MLARWPYAGWRSWRGVKLGAEQGLKDHDRWLLARTFLARRLVGRRNSKLPALVDLVLARPLLSATMIADELGVTPRAAQDLVAELGLREMTGRGRYRAWGVLTASGVSRHIGAGSPLSGPQKAGKRSVP